MSFINCGAKSGGSWVQTKKRLKELLRDKPSDVTFVKTSMFEADQSDIPGDNIPQGVNLSVVGPDPWRQRTWYASVSRRGPKITVQ